MSALSMLIVDDSAMMRRMIRQVIALSGYEDAAIHEAGNGREALAVLDAYDVQVLITDLNMPVMNGTELLTALAARERGPVARLVITTDGSAARREAVTGLGVTRYLEKPLRPEVLRDVLREVVDASRS